MNPKWLKLAAEMLRDNARHLGGKCSTDWDFPADWTGADRAEFCLAVQTRDGTPEDFDPDRLALPDYAVAGFLAAELEKTPPADVYVLIQDGTVFSDVRGVFDALADAEAAAARLDAENRRDNPRRHPADRDCFSVECWRDNGTGQRSES